MKRALIILSFLAAITVTSRSLLHPEFFRVHDFVHGARIVEMTTALRDGHFPVRWSPNFAYGYGMPLFEFYAPLPYYFGSIVYLLTNNILLAVKSLWLIPSIISFWGAFILGKRLFGVHGGIVAAILFTLAPYRAVDLYIRGAIGEVWAMAFFPWVFDGILGIAKNERWSWKALSASLLGLFLSHNLMTMLFFPFAALTAFLVWLSRAPRVTFKERLKISLHYIIGFTIPVGLATFYLVPALLEKHYTQVEERILTGYFHYSQHFLYLRQFFKENWQYGGSQWGPGDDMSFFLGHVQLIALVFTSVMLVYYGIRYMKDVSKVIQKSTMIEKVTNLFSHIYERTVILALLFPFFIVSCFMSLQRSEVLWQTLAPLQVTQFPWRFLSLTIFFLALLGAWGISYLHTQKIQTGVVLIVIFATSVLSWKYFVPESFLEDSQALYYSDAYRIQTEMSDILPDYIPTDLSEDILPRGESTYEVKNGEANVEVVHHKTHSIQLKIAAMSEAVLQANVAYFPGWMVFINSDNTPYRVNEHGLIEFIVPAGTSVVDVALENTQVRAVADFVTLLAVFVLITIILLENKYSRKS